MSDKTEFQIERIAFFSDAVFAIAITLLIIELHPPVFTNTEITNNEALKEFLFHFLPEFIGIVISFFLISLNWRRHHQLYGILNNYDDKLITLNFLSLIGIIFLPFSTAFLSKNWEHFWIHPLTIPFVVYSLNNLACAFFNYRLFRYALNPKNELYAPNGKLDAERIKLEVMFPIFVFSATTVIGYFNSFAGCAAFALFAFEPLFIKFVLQRGKTDET
ncbi:MAG: TMEM175 family protein [Actinomycetota bacterium]